MKKGLSIIFVLVLALSTISYVLAAGNNPGNSELTLTLSKETVDLSNVLPDATSVNALILSSNQGAKITVNNVNTGKLIYTFDANAEGFYYDQENEWVKIETENGLVINVAQKEYNIVPIREFGQQLNNDEKNLLLQAVNDEIDLDTLNVIGLYVPENPDYFMKVDGEDILSIMASDDGSFVLAEVSDSSFISKELPLEINFEGMPGSQGDAEAAVQGAGEKAGETVPAEEQPEQLCLDNDAEVDLNDDGTVDSYFVPSYVTEYLPTDNAYNERTVADWCAVQEVSPGEYKTTLYEWKCEDDHAKVELVSCSDFDEVDENGNIIKDYECWKGACVNVKETQVQIRFCHDPDPFNVPSETGSDEEWKNAFENTFGKQRVTVGVYAPEQVYEKSEKKDYCVNGDKLIEYYCSEDVTLFRQVSCACDYGKCIEPPYCFETDGGITDNIKGTIKAITKDGTFVREADYCDGNTLKEYYCTLDNDNGYAIEDIDCPGKCSEGRCVECSTNSDCDSGEVCEDGECIEKECNDVCEPNMPGMVAYFGFEKDACDSISSDIANTVGTHFVGGKIGHGLRLNKKSSYGVIEIQNDPSLQFDNQDLFTLECWVKTKGDGIQNCIRTQNNPDGGAYGLRINEDGLAEFFVRDENGVLVSIKGTNEHSANLNDGNWHHLVGVRGRDANRNKLWLYVDGSIAKSYGLLLDGSVEDTTTGSFNSGENIYIGAYYDGNEFKEALNGLIDEVAVYSEQLTPEQIKSHYDALMSDQRIDYLRLIQHENNLISYWNFNDGTTNDAHGNNNGQIIGNVVPNEGVSMQGLLFKIKPGTENAPEYWEIENKPELEFSADDSFSLECWVKTKEDGIQNCIRTQNNADDNKALYGLRLKDGRAEFLIRDHDGPGNDVVKLLSPEDNLLNDNKWHHLVGVRFKKVASETSQGISKVKLYVDGNLVNEADETSINTDIDSGKNIYIGAYEDTNGDKIELFKGLLDEVAVYNRALSDNEVKAHYEQSDKHYCDVEVGTATTTEKECTACHADNPFAIWQWQDSNCDTMSNDAVLVWCPSGQYCSQGQCVDEPLNDLDNVKTALERRLTWAQWLNTMLGRAEEQNGKDNLAEMNSLNAMFESLTSGASLASESGVSVENTGKDNNEECTSDFECTSGICVGGICTSGEIGSSCMSDDDCQVNLECWFSGDAFGQCKEQDSSSTSPYTEPSEKKPIGSECNTQDECQTDSTCMNCNTDCSIACMESDNCESLCWNNNDQNCYWLDTDYNGGINLQKIGDKQTYCFSTTRRNLYNGENCLSDIDCRSGNCQTVGVNNYQCISTVKGNDNGCPDNQYAESENNKFCKDKKAAGYGCSKDYECLTNYCNKFARICAPSPDDETHSAYKTLIKSTRGLISYWSFDYNDAFGNDENYNNNIQFKDKGGNSGYTNNNGISGHALQLVFDPDHGGGYGEISNDPSLQFNLIEDFSLECWIKTGGKQPHADTENAQNCIRTQNNQNNGAYGLRLENNGKAHFFIRARGESNVPVSVKGTSRLDDGEWHHLVGVKTLDGLKLYVDGEKVDETEYSNRFGTINSGKNIFIGAYYDGQRDVKEFFNGLIDEVAVYKKALTEDEIKEHYQKGA